MADAAFDSDDLFIQSTSGHTKLEWSGMDGVDFEVQIATDKSFNSARSIYAGPDKATFVSGLADGQYYFRVRENTSPWSQTLVLDVKHHSLALAISLFVVGFVVFGLTTWLVMDGARKTSASLIT